MDASTIGFNAEVKAKSEMNISDAFKRALPQDFVKFGLIPEFIGRVPITVSLDALDRNALIRILQEPKNSLIKQYTKLLELDGVGLEFKDDAVEAIADKALERKTGARGLYIALPQGYEAQVRPRSGLALKHGISVLNSPGTIDADYRGEICVILVNLSEEPFIVNDGERIAQMVIARHEQAEWEQVDVLDETERGAGGFGHSGVK